MKTILLTGATGFLGKKILDDLNSKDFNIYVISRKNENFFSDYHNVTKVFKTKNVVGFDIVELAPIKEQPASNFLATKLYYKMLSYKFNHS